MLNLNILRNGAENNIKLPAKNGDVGFDVVAHSISICGKTLNDGDIDITLQVKNLDELREKFFSRIDYIEYDTGIQYELDDDKYYGKLVPRSSISKYNLVLANSPGTIDLGYKGNIKLRYKYIIQPEDFIIDYSRGFIFHQINIDKIYKIGDKIGQLIFINFNIPKIREVNELGHSERSDTGFGSTDAHRIY